MRFLLDNGFASFRPRAKHVFSAKTRSYILRFVYTNQAEKNRLYERFLQLTPLKININMKESFYHDYCAKKWLV